MKKSRRALRMERRHRRHGAAGGLNLVALMDIFTLLVFFLLVNSGEADLLPSARSIELPESTAIERPRETVVVMVTPQEILVQGRRVIGLDEMQAGEDGRIPELTAELLALDARRVRAVDGEAGGPETTIMASRELPYSLLRRIMLACAEAGYGKIAFAVLQRGQENGE